MALTVDGKAGKATVIALQKHFKVKETGVISGQNKSLSKYYPSLSAVSYGSGGSAVVKKLQKWVGAEADGIIGKFTVKALQKKLDVEADGIWGTGTTKALQKWLNSKSTTKKKTTTKTTTKATSKTTSTKKVDYPVIDVSYVQSSINWKKVKAAGIKGAIIRCGYRGYGSGKLIEDSKFYSHIKGAHAAGLKVGVYFFTEAISEAEGKEEAQYTIKMVKKAGIDLSYPIAVDTEYISARNPVPRANNISVAKRTAAIKGFCKEIKAQGFEPMIYGSTDWLNRKLDMSKLPYKVWVAQYNSRVTYKGSYVMWQYSSLGRVSGIDEVVDLNHCYYEQNQSLKAPVPSKTVKTTSPAPKATPKVVATKKAYSGNFPSLVITEEEANKMTHKAMANWANTINSKGLFHYVLWNNNIPATHECPICKKHKVGAYYGWNCIGFASACWHHGGNLSTKCHCGTIDNALGTKMLTYSKAKMLAKAQERFGTKDIKVIYNNGNPIPQSMLEAGDICLMYDGKIYSHMFFYTGDGKVADSGRGMKPQVGGGRNYSAYYKKTKIAFRYTGRGAYGTTAALEKGDVRKSQVKQWQKFINWVYGKEVVVVDGQLGTSTINYTKKVQEKIGVTPDGEVGPKTIAKAKAYKK